MDDTEPAFILPLSVRDEVAEVARAWWQMPPEVRTKNIRHCIRLAAQYRLRMEALQELCSEAVTGTCDASPCIPCISPDYRVLGRSEDDTMRHRPKGRPLWDRRRAAEEHPVAGAFLRISSGGGITNKRE